LYCNFLKINSEGYLNFKHLSAKVFIYKIKEKGFDNSDFRPESFLSRSCLHYLGTTKSGSYQTDRELKEWWPKYQLYGYAARHWVFHFKQAGNRDEISKTASIVFKTRYKIFHQWFPIY
jgi:hypothetical protein